MTGDRTAQLQALSVLRLDWATTPDDVWGALPEHVPALHEQVSRRILEGVAAAKRSSGGSPLGLVIQGEKGSGKTHLLGSVREQIQVDGGYFFLIGLSHGELFWANTVEAILDGLWRAGGNGQGTQLELLLRRLGTKAGTSRAIETLLSGAAISRPRLDSFVRGINEIPGHHGGPELQDTARALVLYASGDSEIQDIAKDYFLFAGDIEATARTTWGIRAGRPPRLIVRDLSRLMALTGHTVIAIDQIDALIARSARSFDSVDVAQEDADRDELVTQVADGLMELRELTRNTLSIVACLPNSWALIRTRAVDTVRDRFRAISQLTAIPSADVGRELVAKRFAAGFRELAFTPPYATWPIAPEAFAEAVDFTPRGLLRRIDAHIESCLDNNEIVELRRLEGHLPVVETTSAPVLPGPDAAMLDARFQELKSRADIGSVFDPKGEDAIVPGLLSAGLTSWIEENGGPRSGYDLDPPPGRKPALHARLRRTVNENVEAEVHWAFRAICSPNAVAAQSRVRDAVTESGIKPGDATRSLILLRNTRWPNGVRTAEIVDGFHDAGGIDLVMTDDDLRIFAALAAMLADRHPSLQPWLAARQPAGRTELFRVVLPGRDPGPAGDDSPPTRPIPIVIPAAAVTPTGPSIPTVAPLVAASSESATSIPLGRHLDSDQTVTLELESLRMHTAIFAGSGSGKTVLLRRMVEECALKGVSAIVLDPNNDLARLGDAWPSAPSSWGLDDAGKAERYLADTDVVIWTPRRESGRPLTFQPLPDFAGVLDDPDEFQMAVDVAFGALAPRARAEGRTRKAQQERAVLIESIKFFGRAGGGGLEDLIDVMANLPPEASRIAAAGRMAAEMAETLTAAMVNDPLFGGAGQAVDPAVLLTPIPGKRARVSVISLIGLQSDEQRQGFVSQLQMALFAWFKKNPSDGLGGLLVMDEAQTIAPSGAMTVATTSTLVLASQARKYGLGLVFATQAPKGLHNRIPGNAATQVYGLLNSPSQIDTARELGRAKGGDISDISRLKRGQFYVAAEGAAFVKIRTAMCLSHHPSSPLSADAVIARARGPVGSTDY